MGPQNTAERVVYRQSAWTRIAHWTWAVCLFFLATSGLQILSAHPALYVGEQSGFAFDNAVLRIGAIRGETVTGHLELLGRQFETTGLLGVSGGQVRPFPAWATTPSYLDLATGRIIHFFFAWVLLAALVTWLGASLLNGHLRRDLWITRADLRALPAQCLVYARLRFRPAARYNCLQKLSYGFVMFVLMPLAFATGLAMSPGANAVVPWLTDVLGGKETARTLHFVTMLLLGGFFVVHMVMLIVTGPLNGLRSMITGWCRVEAGGRPEEEAHGPR